MDCLPAPDGSDDNGRVDAFGAGAKIGRFRIERELGAGGMGVVYEAVDERLDRRVALKVLPPDALGDDERRRRFLREARAAAAVTHPNVAVVYDADEVLGRIFIAMELVRGESLRERLARGPLGVGDALRVARAVLAGVAAAHAAGVVHRDLKPDNVMIDASGHVKVLDFGIARREPSPDARAAGAPGPTGPVTREGQVIGTPGYMSPEQALGMSLDRRSDVFSLGVMLYEMVTGRLPFAGPTPTAVILATVRDEPTPPRVLVPTLPLALEEIVLACLHKVADERPADAAAVLERLEALAHDGAAQDAGADGVAPAPAAQIGLAPTVSRGPITSALAATVAASAVSKRRPSRRAALVAAVLGLLVAGGAAVWAISRTPGAPATASPASSSTGVPITSLPDPQTTSPDALAAFRRALTALRAADWALAERELERAVELDPSFAAAQLRLALALDVSGQPSRAREAFKQAEIAATTLDERDRAFLLALEPYLTMGDRKEAGVRLEAARRRFTGDAELAWMAAYMSSESDPKRTLDAADAALAIDPLYADAWQAKAWAHNDRGETEMELDALARCVERIPAATDCRMELAHSYAGNGRCHEMLTVAKRIREGYEELIADALLATGAGATAAEEALRQGRPLAAPERAVVLDAHLGAIHALEGRFPQAFEHAREAARRAGSQPAEAPQARAARLLAELELETGNPAGAADLAADFLRRHAALLPSSLRQPRNDERLWMTSVRHLAGRVDAAEMKRAREQWIASWGQARAPAGEVWFYGHASLASTADEARAALAAAPVFRPGTRRRYGAHPDVAVGRVYVLAGRAAEALPHLERGARSCWQLPFPFDRVRVQLWLGRAYAETGATAQACAAYRTVLERWGRAEPRSVTAEEARERAAKLGCP
jgi:serine/threonine-protein kinase